MDAVVRSAMPRQQARFLRKTLKARNSSNSRVINVDKHRAYPQAVDELKNDGLLPQTTKLRQNKYLNNMIEQDHRFMRAISQTWIRFKSFNTARRTLKEYETLNMIRKGQVIGVSKGDFQAQLKFIAQSLGVAA